MAMTTEWLNGILDYMRKVKSSISMVSHPHVTLLICSSYEDYWLLDAKVKDNEVMRVFILFGPRDVDHMMYYTVNMIFKIVYYPIVRKLGQTPLIWETSPSSYNPE